MSPYTAPVTHALGIDRLDEQTVTFVLGLVGSPTAHVAWTMPRDEWDKHGRPAVLFVTVASPEVAQ